MREKNKFNPYLFFLLSIVFFNSCAWWEKQKGVSLTNLSSEECGYSQAPFIASQIEKSAGNDAISIIQGRDGLNKAFTLNLKTCLRDYIRPDNPIQHVPFVIEYYSSEENKRKGQLSKANATSDIHGCIQWQEEYSYKYTVQPLWIGLERIVKKEKGAYAGAETIPMAVNPWLSDRDRKSGLPYILDTRCEYSKKDRLLKEDQSYEPNGLKYLSETQKEERPLLWVPDISVQIHEVNPYKEQMSSLANAEADIRQLLKRYQQVCEHEDSKNCYRRQMEINLYVPLKLRTVDRSGVRDDELLGGVYDVDTQLVISPKGIGDNYRLHENVCVKNNINFNQTNQSLSLTCNLNFSYFNQNALYKLVIRIKPSSKALPFKNFEGVYTMNLNFQDEKRNPTVDNVYDNNYKEVLTTPKELKIIENMNIKNVSDLLQSHNDSIKSRFEQVEDKEVLIDKGPIKGLSFYRLHLDGYGEYKLSHVESGGSKCSDRENVVERTVVFVGKLCLTDVLSSQKLNNTPFRVFLEKPREGAIEEIYDESQERKQLFKADGRSCISVPIKIKHKLYNRQKYFQVDMHVLSEELNLYGKVRLALSPWQRAFQAFQDAQNLPEDVIRFDTQGVREPQLIINQFRSINLFPSYGLDKLLNIHLFHRFYLLFQPLIRRPDNLSLGLDYKAREVLRDGHYLVRVLVLRNPQETGDFGKWARTKTMDEINQSRDDKVTDEFISLKNTQYITHTDSVVKAKANFINFYMPLYLSTRQFYYIASRNFIVIEIHPADPNYFVYENNSEGNGDCVVDAQKTVWKPFRNHELESAPYVGAFNIQHWVNWNLLQPAKDVNTDEIIEQSEIGRKHKHFNFSLSSEEGEISSQKAPVNLGCVNKIASQSVSEVEERLSRYEDGEIITSFDPSKEEVKKCSVDNSKALSPGLEIYKEREEKSFTSTVLEDFSKENSLKLIDLSDRTAGQFIRDMQSSFEKYKRMKRLFINGSFSDFIVLDNGLDTLPIELIKQERILLQQLPEEDSHFLKFRIKNICRSLECSSGILKAYLTNIHHSLNTEEPSIQIIIDLINENQLLSDSDRELFNQSLNECETRGPCLAGAKDFLKEILDIHISHLSFYEQNLFLENLMLFFSKEQKRELFNQIDQQCFPWPAGIFKDSEDYKGCYYKVFSSFYEKMLIERSNFQNYAGQVSQRLRNKAILQHLNVSESARDSNLLKSIMNEPMEETLFRMIETGVKNENRYSPDTLSFTKPLCFFWFDHYLKNYLGQDQMISSYTTYISKFDYHQILDRSYSYDEQDQVMSFYPKFIKYLSAQDNTQSAGCYDDYTQCVLADYCQDRSINQSNNGFCSQMDIQDPSCNSVIETACQKNPSLSLCHDECLLNPHSSHCGKQNFCNRKVRDFCLLNKDQDLCDKYENRCFADYLPCLKTNTSVFNINHVLNYRDENVDFEPLKTCLNNPYDFFQFENKMVVHKLSTEENKYLGGFLKTFNVSANYSIGSYMNWTAQRGRAVSAGGDASIGSGSFSVKILNRLSGSLKMSLSQSISSNESNSGRRAIDNRAGEGVYLTIGNANFQIAVKKFQNCLVVKPKPDSFMAKPEEGKMKLYENIWSQSANELKKIIVSRSGLIICNPIEEREDKEPKYITESYYYVSQVIDPGNSQFLNLYDLANRPFVLVLRGQREFVKLYHMLKMTIEGDNGAIEENGGINRPPENMFVEYPFSIEEAVGLNLTIREFNKTGFSPGIYHYPYDSDQHLDTWFANEKAQNNFFMRNLSEYNLFDVPTHTNQSIPVQSR